MIKIIFFKLHMLKILIKCLMSIIYIDACLFQFL